MNKQPQIQEETKQNLRDAFWELYQNAPIEKISIKEITDKAGYNRSTFYLYYTDIYDIRDQLEDRLLAEIRDIMSNIDAKKAGSESALGLLAEVYENYGDYLYHLLRIDSEFYAKWKKVFVSLVSPAFAKSSGWKQEARIETFASAALGALSYWYVHRNEISVDEFVPYIRQMLAEGIMADLP